MKLSPTLVRIVSVGAAGVTGAIAAISVALLAACAATTPRWDAHFGDATRIALAQQIIAPAAARNADPVAGIDGRAAAQAQLRYQKSFAEPAQSSGDTIGAGDAK